MNSMNHSGRIAVIVVLIQSLPLWTGASDRLAAAEAVVETGIARIDAEDLRRHVMTLASDALEGREAGGRGGKAAAGYLRSVLKSIRQTYPLPLETTQEFGNDYQNLLLLLPGSDPVLQREVIVVGAHYDHVGYGKVSNSQGPIGQIHNGADDNASGTSAVLELIEAFASQETRPARSLLFAFWDAEEVGLLGSKHWVAHPSIPLNQIRFALNLDMLGRLRDGRIVTVGWRSAPGLRHVLARHNHANELLLAFQPSVIADSDHHPFYAAGIPVIHMDTDKHDDYHRPSDDPEKLNWEGIRQLAQFSYQIVDDAANRPDFPSFRREALTEGAPTWMNPREPMAAPIRLGVNWDQGRWGQGAAVVSRVNPNSPAARAGLRPGDRLIRLGSWQNGTTDELKAIIQVATNPVPVRIERPNVKDPVDILISLQGNPVRLGAGWMDDAALPNSVVVTHVVADSPAHRSGIAAGDVIIEMGGQMLASSEDLRKRVLVEPGPFEFRIERQGRIREVTVEVVAPYPQTPLTTQRP